MPAETLTRGLAAFQEGDYETAIALLEPYARAGEPEAQAILGNLYHLGLGVAVSIEQAIYWYQLAASQGYGLASNNLACLLIDQAEALYQQAKAQGFQHAPSQTLAPT